MSTEEVAAGSGYSAWQMLGWPSVPSSAPSPSDAWAAVAKAIAGTPPPGPVLTSVFWNAKDNRAVEGQVVGVRATGAGDRLKPGTAVVFQILFEPSADGGAAVPKQVAQMVGKVTPGLAQADWTVKIANAGAAPPAGGLLHFCAVAQGEKLTSLKIPYGAAAGAPSVLEVKLVGAGHESRSHTTAPEKIADAEKFHFAPSVETVKIAYKIEDPSKLATGGSLALFRCKDGAALWARPLTTAELAAGDHAIEWNGAVTNAPLLPGGFPTVEHSPYELKIQLGADVQAKIPAAWTFFRVLLGDLVIEKGLDEYLASDRDKAMNRTLRFIEVPQQGEIKVVLKSDCYKLASAEMADGSSFTQYASMWGEGPSLPIVARLSVKTSDDRSVEVPKVLGKQKVLWDWVSIKPPAGDGGRAATFVTQALEYASSDLTSIGTNCHFDRGGKRGDGAKPVFPPQAGIPPGPSVPAGKFPWKVEACASRTGSVFSEVWTEGECAGQAGVLFNPTRMAGDGYRLVARMLPEGSEAAKLDTASPLSTLVTRFTGTFRVWRELHVTRIVRKSTAVTEIDLDAVRAHYKPSFIDIVEEPGARILIDKANFDAQFKVAVAREQWYIQGALAPVDQYLMPEALCFHDHDAFKAMVAKNLGMFDDPLDKWLKDKYVSTVEGYAEACKEWAKRILTTMSNFLLHAMPGLNILQYGDDITNREADRSSHLNGSAVSAQWATRNRCAFLMFTSKWQTFAHELGHQLFLPHAPAGDPDGKQPQLHDADETDCLMSYASDREELCGLCSLRLRGWDHGKLQNDGSLNSK